MKSKGVESVKNKYVKLWYRSIQLVFLSSISQKFEYGIFNSFKIVCH